MKKILILSLCLVGLIGIGLSAATATIVEVQGSVSVRQWAGGPWQAGYGGLVLQQGATITTGFQSAITLRVMPTGSVVRLNQFTTVSVDALGQSGQTVETSLNLKMGTVRAVVKNTVNERSKFVVTTPVATASVRGTIPEVSHFPDTGTRIAYLQGSGYVAGRRGKMQLLAQNQQSTIGTDGSVSDAGSESNKRTSAAADSLGLTASERAALYGGRSGRFLSQGFDGKERLNQFKKWQSLSGNGRQGPIML